MEIAGAAAIVTGGGSGLGAATARALAILDLKAENGAAVARETGGILPAATPQLLAELPQETKDALATAIPYPTRLGEPAEFAAPVVAMVENDYLNGEIVRLDGALRMQAK